MLFSKLVFSISLTLLYENFMTEMVKVSITCTYIFQGRFALYESLNVFLTLLPVEINTQLCLFFFLFFFFGIFRLFVLFYHRKHCLALTDIMFLLTSCHLKGFGVDLPSDDRIVIHYYGQ